MRAGLAGSTRRQRAPLRESSCSSTEGCRSQKRSGAANPPSCYGAPAEGGAGTAPRTRRGEQHDREQVTAYPQHLQIIETSEKAKVSLFVEVYVVVGGQPHGIAELTHPVEHRADLLARVVHMGD